MGRLNKALATKHAKLRQVHLGSVVNALSIATGFDLIDYACATICETPDNEEFLNIGLPMGKLYEFIGNSQGGKTTLAYQIADSFVKDLDGDIIALDYERSSNNLRLRYSKINSCTRQEFDERVSLYNHPNMSTEFLKEIIFDIVEMKKAMKKADLVQWQDVDGKDLLIYPPTVIILDSVPAMKPNDVLNDPKLDSKMVAGMMAAANSSLLKSIVHVLETYNITIMAINHITTKINTNQYAPRVVILPGLSETENLPGGNCWAYIPSYVFKLTSGQELKADKDFVEGRFTEVRILKTRSGFNNSRLKFVLAAKTGFSNAHTMVNWAKDNKLLSGTGQSGFSFDGSDDKFKLKGFEKKYKTDETFKEAFDELVQGVLGEGVNDRYSDIEEQDVDAVDLEDEFADE